MSLMLRIGVAYLLAVHPLFADLEDLPGSHRSESKVVDCMFKAPEVVVG